MPVGGIFMVGVISHNSSLVTSNEISLSNECNTLMQTARSKFFPFKGRIALQSSSVMIISDLVTMIFITV